MKTIIIHHVNEDFTQEWVETIKMMYGAVVEIQCGKWKPL
jgi:hypothetical protein